MENPKRRKLDDIEEIIIHPILPDELIEDTPLIEVYTAPIANSKDISKAIISLNAVLPLPEFIHLKRIKAKNILICPTNLMKKDEIFQMLKERSFDVLLLNENITTAFVAKIAPKVRRQYDIVNKLWPCNFHSNKYLEKLSTNTLFTKKDLESHKLYMSAAIEVAKFRSCSIGAVVVDPQIDSIVTAACSDQRGPCRHAAMVVVDNVAKTQNGGAWKTYESVQSNSALNLSGFSADVLNHLRKKFEGVSFGATWFKGKSNLTEPVEGPYLCTGYYVYLTREPCVMCAMALVHSRVKRVFYGVTSSNGGLGTLCKVHTVKDLNHHYEVFAGLLESHCKELDRDSEECR